MSELLRAGWMVHIGMARENAESGWYYNVVMENGSHKVNGWDRDLGTAIYVALEKATRMHGR